MVLQAISDRFPYLNIRLRVDLHDEDIHTEALVVTGFEGDVMMPRLRLPASVRPSTRRSFLMGDGRVIHLASYPGELQIVGLERIIRVAISEGRLKS